MRAALFIFPLFFYLSINAQQGVKFEWARSAGSGNSDFAAAVAVDGAGNVYHAGDFRGLMDCDPGPGVYEISPHGGIDAYVIKYDAQGNFLWAKTYGSYNETQESVRHMAVDAAGNIYLAGHFNDLVDFDPGPGVFFLVSNAALNDGYLLKLDPDGNFLWAKNIAEGWDYNAAQTVTVSPSGFIYIGGLFRGTTDFDPGPGTVSLTTTGTEQNAFVAKYDAAGNFIWAKGFMGQRTSVTSSIRVDAYDNVYSGGTFYGTTDFDPGSGTFDITNGNTGVASSFVTKLDANGNFIWAKYFSSAGASNRCMGLALDPSSNVLLTGSFHANTDFNPGAGIFIMSGPGMGKGYVAKLTTNGDFVWAKKFQTSGASPFDDVQNYSIDCDADGDIYVSGSMWGNTNFDPGASNYTIGPETTSNIAYIAKLKSDGSFVWALELEGNLPSEARSMCVDLAKNIYINGPFYGIADHDPTNGVYKDTSVGYTDAYLIKLSQCFNVTTEFNVGCDSFHWEGQTYTNSGTYTVTYPAADGCDSIRILNLSLMHTTYHTVDMTICEGQTYLGYTTSGTYIDTYVSNARCDSVRTLNLTVNPKKQTAIMASICEGESYFAAGALQTTDGVYTETFTSATGCDSVITTTLTVHLLPVPKLGIDLTMCEGSTVVLNPGPFTSYVWQDLSIAPAFNANAQGTYWVKVTTNNCSASDTINITIKPCFQGVYIPSAFSPNNDNLNDVFRASVNADIVSFKLEVYNRWGELVFRTSDPSKGWDGKRKGTKLDTGVFIWICKYQLRGKPEVLQKGKLALIR